MRTFVAIDLTADLRQALAQVEAALSDHLRGHGNSGRLLRWAGVEKAHLTLRFLGETTPTQAREMQQGLAALALGCPPFALSLGGLGCFPAWGRPRVIWIGVGGARSELSRIQAQGEALAQAAGFAGEERPYSPHITLARTARQLAPPEQKELAAALAGFRADPPLDFVNLGRVWVDRLLFVRSELRPTGSVYTSLGAYLLEG